MDKSTKLIITIVACVIGLFIAWNVALLVSRRGLDKIEVYAIPSDSSITIDGKLVSSGAVYVTPGKHIIEATRQYFDKDITSVDTNSSEAQEPIYLLPNPGTDQAKQWLIDHPEESQKREGIISIQVAQDQQKLLNQHPILKQLPAYNSHYRIDYALGENDELKFSITLYAIINGPSDHTRYINQLYQYKNEALEFLRDNGIDTNKVPIEFTPEI